jgi:hypothetical protein
MTVVRVFLAALVAISVAVVPAAGIPVVSTAPVEMSMPDNADMPCCPCCNEQDHSKSSGACALKCLNFVGVVLPAMAVAQPYLVDAARPSFMNDALHEYVIGPPTHPPSV